MNGNKYMAPHGHRFSRYADRQLERIRQLKATIAKIGVPAQPEPKRFASLLQSEEDKRRTQLNNGN